MKKYHYYVQTDKGSYSAVDLNDAKRILRNFVIAGSFRWAQIETYVLLRKGKRQYGRKA